MESQKIALLCTIRPTSAEARSEILSLLTSASREYYQSSKSQCTTWSYFTPSTRAKAPSQMVPASEKNTLIGGMEIYTDKKALSTQQEEKWFKDFNSKLKNEGLVTKPDELVAWYPTAGFVSRDDATSAGQGTIVMVAVFKCKSGKRDQMVEVLRKYTQWVKENEPDVLTYCVMTRPKSPDEVILFERYKDPKALGAHGSTKEFKAMFKGIAPFIEVKQLKLQEFAEIDDSFVSNVEGGTKRNKSAKL